VMEMQARWAARTMSRQTALPPLSEMEKGLEGEERIRGKDGQVRPQFPHPDYVQFADSTAAHAHSFPNLDKLRNPQLPLTESLGQATNKMEDVIKRLEGRKEEIATRFMNDSVTPSHYNLCQDPVSTLEQMQTTILAPSGMLQTRAALFSPPRRVRVAWRLTSLLQNTAHVK